MDRDTQCRQLAFHRLSTLLMHLQVSNQHLRLNEALPEGDLRQGQEHVQRLGLQLALNSVGDVRSAL